MDTNQSTGKLTDYAMKNVHHKARKLIGQLGFTESDQPDIEHDLIVDLLERLPKFDPSKAAYNTFVACVVRRKVSNLVRHRQVKRRDHQREACSLNEDIRIGDDEVVQRVATIDQDEHDIRIGKHNHSAEDRRHLHLDVQAVLDKLPPDLRKAAELLKTKCITQVARELGVPRRTFREKHLVRLRRIFREAALVDYLI